MTQIDLTGLAVAVTLGGVLAALGAGIDNLLLARQVKALNTLSLRWWVFFDDLKLADVPRTAVKAYIKGKNYILGSDYSLSFVLRIFLMSTLLTLMTVFGGRVAGIILLQECNRRSGWMADSQLSLTNIVNAAWQWTGTQSIAYLAVTNVLFDFATIFVTIFLLAKAISKSSYVFLTFLLIDIIACAALFQNAIFINDKFDTASRISVDGYWAIWPTLVKIPTYGCGAFHLLTSKLLFVGTILLPTLIYIVMIVGLFFLRESFLLLRFVTMHVLEKSVEEKKTLFAHIGTAIGLFVATGKAIIELAKTL